MRIEFTKLARSDVRQAVEYLRTEDAEDMVPKFLAAVAAEVERVAQVPLSYRERRPGVRSKPLARPWRYSLMYAVEDDVLLILAVAHQRRRFGYWDK